MPIHDWTKVEAGIYHAFHHEWISEISRALNRGLLPASYYALPEQVAAGFGPDVVTLQDHSSREGESNVGGVATATIRKSRPQTRFVSESDGEFYRRKKSSIAVRHVSGDRLVAIVEIISPGNKSSRHAFQAFVEKACEFLEHRVHLLLIDPLPPGQRDPEGIHGAIWEQVEGSEFLLPRETPLTLAAYECGLITRAYVETIAVGNPLPNMPLFLEPDGHVEVPLEETYLRAIGTIPQRWLRVLEG
jgi:uncharacterized protein DUF4058